MTTTTSYLNAVASKMSVAPTITIVTDTLTITATQITVDSQNHALPETTYTATSRASATDVRGWIVRRRSDAVVMYMVDEIVLDGIDQPYILDNSPYEPLFSLFLFRVPPTTTDLTTCAISVTQTRAFIPPTTVQLPATPPPPQQAPN